MSVGWPGGLYAIVDAQYVPLDRMADVAGQLVAAGARIVQVRAKGVTSRALLAAVRAVRQAVAAHDAWVVVDDRLDVALLAGATGVHLGQQDLPVAVARRIAPPPFRIGLSVHDDAQLEAAGALPVDYVAVGPVFPTHSKARPDPVVGLDGLRRLVRRSRRPVVAIGGIDARRIGAVRSTGAAAAAVIGALYAAGDPGRAAARLVAAWHGEDV